MSNSTTPAPRKNLLTLALEQERPIWHSGETVTLVADRQGRPKAYLKEMTCVVYLCTGKDLPELPVFRLDIEGWITVPNLEQKYPAWVARCQELLDPQRQARKEIERQALLAAMYRNALGRSYR